MTLMLANNFRCLHMFRTSSFSYHVPELACADRCTSKHCSSLPLRGDEGGACPVFDLGLHFLCMHGALQSSLHTCKCCPPLESLMAVHMRSFHEALVIHSKFCRCCKRHLQPLLWARYT